MGRPSSNTWKDAIICVFVELLLRLEAFLLYSELKNDRMDFPEYIKQCRSNVTILY